MSLENSDLDPLPTLSELLCAARQGDGPSIEALVSRFSGPIEQECGKYGIRQHPELSHSDLFQEVILRVWTRIEQFSGRDQENLELIFDSWIRKTARSVLSNLFRAEKAKKRRPDDPVQSYDEATLTFVSDRHGRTASSIFSDNEEVERLNNTIEQYLDDTAQQILNLRIVEGLSLKDIAARLSLTYEQVRYNYQSSLAELEKRLA